MTKRASRVGILATAGFMGLFSSSVAFAESSTIRIDEEQQRGASITIEAGVLVYRGLPPTRFLVINPGGKTPLSLDLSEKRELKVSRSVSYNQHDYHVRRWGNTVD